ILLCLVEAVDLVEEEDRAPAGSPEALARPREHLAHVLHRRRHGRQLLERGTRRRGDDPRERRLPTAGRAVEDGGADPVLLDRQPQRRPFAEDMGLADEVAEARRPQPLRERRDLAGSSVGGVGEKVTHVRSMLRPVSASVADSWSGASYERIAETFASI